MEQNVILNAKDSDPEKLKWMMGFPPEKEKIISAKDGSFFPPHARPPDWARCRRQPRRAQSHRSADRPC